VSTFYYFSYNRSVWCSPFERLLRLLLHSDSITVVVPEKDYWDYYYTLTVYCSGAGETNNKYWITLLQIINFLFFAQINVHRYKFISIFKCTTYMYVYDIGWKHLTYRHVVFCIWAVYLSCSSYIYFVVGITIL
jgi:hypothetical protein